MKLKFMYNFNIRQRLFFAFLMSFLPLVLLGMISIYNFFELETKYKIVESAYDLSNVILETRRYEKNYFLFSRMEDITENKRYIGEAVKLIDEITPNIKNREQLQSINNLAHHIKIYQNLIHRIHDDYLNVSDSKKNQQMANLRNIGQQLVNLSDGLVEYEHKLIYRINQHLKFNFLLSMAMILVFFIILMSYIIRQIVRPLKTIEETTESIAKGKFKKVRVGNKKDEIQQLMMAFNRMVAELEKRQDQLVQAQKLSSIGTLASGIAHQVNNPLNNISTSCQILIEESENLDSELARKMMDNIESETFRAKDIVRGLLEFSRNQEFNLVKTRLKDVVNRSISLISSQIPPGIEIIIRIPDEIEVKLDRLRMQEVFMNLIMNSVQAIQPDSGQISIIASKNANNNKIIISVEDSGKGISEEIRQHVFDPFFTTKDIGLGTGLGLFIVYSAIQSHSGSIRVDNDKNVGTRFVIELPYENVKS